VDKCATKRCWNRRVRNYAHCPFCLTDDERADMLGISVEEVRKQRGEEQK
jgi:hypothetical protein